MKKERDLLLLRRTPLFAGMSDGDIAGALGCLASRERSFPKGAFLVHQGEPLSAMGLVTAGQVHILREDFWGNRDLIGTAEPGDLFGEAYACTGAVCTVSVLAAAETTALFLEAGKLLSPCAAVCPCHAQLILNLLQVTAAKNLLLNEKLGHVTRRTTREKLLSYLSRESVRQGSAAFSIPFDRQQLADYLAVDRSALSAELSQLRRDGFLTFRKNQFVLLRNA